jgi:short-subunit dehydrogenase
MKNALVTGASGGIGLAITKQLAAEGVQLMLVARSVDRLKEIVTTLPGIGHQFLQADLSLQNDIDALASHISGQNYDVLFNNAGVVLYGRFDEIDLEQQLKMLTLNCNALVTLSYAFLRQARSGGALVNISSMLGFSSFPGAAAYAGTKGFLARFSESLYYEYKDRGIYVLALCPGVTATNFHLAAGSSHDEYPGIIVQTPEQVAKETLTALKKRKKPVVISGVMNRGMLLSQRFLSRKQIVNMMGRFSPVK